MLKGKNALVTGSTSGIGLGIAHSLAQEGCNIVLNGFGDENEIKVMKNEMIAKYKVKILYFPTDITDYDKVKEMIEEASSELGSIDILVNNAGIQHVDNVENFPLERWHAVINTNLNSLFYMIQNSLPIMHKKGWGRIINIASAHGLVGSEGKVAYVAAKHGVNGLTKVVALENATKGVTCNSICPGWVLTPLVKKQIIAIQEQEKITYEEAEKHLLEEKEPSMHFTLPEDIGDMVVFLCGKAGDNITGSIISMDGGWTAR